MNKIKKAIARTEKFVEDHKVGIAVTATALVCLKLNRIALRQHDNFLKEHDLYDAFYVAEE